MDSLYPPWSRSGWVMNIIKSRWLDTNCSVLSKHKHDIIVCTNSTLPVYNNTELCYY